MKRHFQVFALYNRWANQRLYQAAAGLSESQRQEDRGAFFGSVVGTLNHILVGDRAWLARLTGEGPRPTRLDEILFADLDALGRARDAEDARLIAYVDGLTADALHTIIAYRSMLGDPFEQPVERILAHMFNHQTHHRGQVHALLTQFGLEAPALDLIYFARALPAGELPGNGS